MTRNEHTPRSLRALRGLTVDELAAEAKSTPRTIRRIERGEGVGTHVLERLAPALGVSVADLLFAWDRARLERESA